MPPALNHRAAEAAPPYRANRLLWASVAAGLLPGPGLVVSLVCAYHATLPVRRRILGMALIDAGLLAFLVLGAAGVVSHTPGLVESPLLGVRFFEEDPGGAAVVEVVFPDTAADAAGLVPGDIIAEVDGVTAEGYREAQARIGAFAPGSDVRLRLRGADGATRDVAVTLGMRLLPSARSMAFHDKARRAVLGAAMVLGIALGLFAAFAGRPRWAGVLLAAIAAMPLPLLFGFGDDLELGAKLPSLFGGVILVFFAFLWWRMRRERLFEEIGRARPSRGFVLGLISAGGWGVRATIAVFLCSVVIDVMPSPASPLAELVDDAGTPSGALLTLALLVVAAPLLEEFVFRGALLPWLATFVSPRKAIALSAILFGAMHIPSHGLHFLVATAYGAALGWTRVRTGSLWPCMLVHACINFAVGLRLLV